MMLGSEVDGPGSGSCPMASTDISSVEVFGCIIVSGALF
jgi:hypothetical protein